jgi:anti-anti-sigma factor
METKISNIDGKVVIKIIGRLDTTVAVDFSREVAPYYSQKDVNMQLDCTDMDYIASSGLRVFLSTYKSLTANGGSLEVSNLQPQVMTVFNMTGFSSFLNIV